MHWNGQSLEALRRCLLASILAEQQQIIDNFEQLDNNNGFSIHIYSIRKHKAFFDYFIEEKSEAGISLHGTEVKSIRMGKCSIKESYIQIENGEVFIYGMHISPYEKGNIFNKDPLRIKKLLLHKLEIRKLERQVQVAGYTIVPLNVYLDRGLVKVEIGLAKGKKLYDKRETIAKNDVRREQEKEFKIKNLY